MGAGRPPKYQDAEQLQKKIDEYWETGIRKVAKVVGEKVLTLPHPSITDLVYFLGFESRNAFYDYEKKKEFKYTIKRARLKIETEYEALLQHGNVAGAIFALKNLGWSDTITQETIVRRPQKLFSQKHPEGLDIELSEN